MKEERNHTGEREAIVDAKRRSKITWTSRWSRGGEDGAHRIISHFFLFPHTQMPHRPRRLSHAKTGDLSRPGGRADQPPHFPGTSKLVHPESHLHLLPLYLGDLSLVTVNHHNVTKHCL